MLKDQEANSLVGYECIYKRDIGTAKDRRSALRQSWNNDLSTELIPPARLQSRLIERILLTAHAAVPNAPAMAPNPRCLSRKIGETSKLQPAVAITIAASEVHQVKSIVEGHIQIPYGRQDRDLSVDTRRRGQRLV